MRYTIDDKPAPLALFLYGLQWWVLLLPNIVIMGLVVSRLHYPDVVSQIWYMRKILVLMGGATVIQVLLGHRLPLVVGPAATLLVGLIASNGSSVGAMYTAMILGGAVMCVLAFSGLISRLRFFFTPRIVAVILILIAFTLSPTMLRLIAGAGEAPSLHLCFAFGMVASLLVCNSLLHGFYKSLTVVVGLVGGSLAYFLLFGFPSPPSYAAMGHNAPGLSLFVEKPELHAGTLLSFFFCYLALVINELGSIESIGQMLGADGMENRLTRGVGIQGLTNMAAGSLGILGPVDYSMSAGVIAATGCASRITLVPAGLALMACALFPRFVIILTMIPEPVMGALMLYLMASQMASGLSMLVAARGITDFASGMTVGLPLMTGVIIAFAPAVLFDGFPAILRPIVGNGFVMGTCAVILMEHLLFRNTRSETG